MTREHDGVHALEHRERVVLEERIELELHAAHGAPEGHVRVCDELVELGAQRLGGGRECGESEAAGV